MIIRSFDAVLREKRSAHSIEIIPGHSRIPLPRSVPYINVLYFVAALGVVVIADNVISLVAIVGAPLSLVAGDASIASWVCCYIMLPAGIVWVATNASVDGRSPHRWVVSAFRYLRRSKRTICGRSIRREGKTVFFKGRVKFWWDLNAPRLHHGRISGGRVTSVVPVRFTHAIRHRNPVITPDEGGVLLDDYQISDEVEIRP